MKSMQTIMTVSRNSLKVSCPSFRVDGLIAEKHTGFGEDISPKFFISGLFDIGSFKMPLALGLLLSVGVGIALFFTGKACWKVTKKYLAWICKMNQNMLENKGGTK